MEYQLVRPDIDTIIDYCNDLEADEHLIVFEYGNNADLVLHIYKDEDYKGGDDCNLVTISTFQNGVAVDDTGDTYVTDGSLLRELKRIAEYKDFCTL